VAATCVDSSSAGQASEAVAGSATSMPQTSSRPVIADGLVSEDLASS
jgi:hypothetical protein